MSQRSTYHNADTDVSLNILNDTRQASSFRTLGDGVVDNVSAQEGNRISSEEKTTEMADISEVHRYNNNTEDGCARIIAEAKDIVTTILHVEDDVSLNPWTFRMFSIGKPEIA